MAVFSSRLKQNVPHIQEALSAHAKAAIKLKLPKRLFSKPQVKLLEILTMQMKFPRSEKKVVEIRKALVLKATTETSSFFGLTRYFKRFIRNFAETSSLLHVAKSRNETLHWTSDTDESYRALQEKFTWPLERT